MEQKDEIIKIKPVMLDFETHKKLNQIKYKIKEETNITLNFNSIINIIIDCIDGIRFERKINYFKKGVGKDEKIS